MSDNFKFEAQEILDIISEVGVEYLNLYAQGRMDFRDYTIIDNILTKIDSKMLSIKISKLEGGEGGE